ncbi:hypothetical protein SAMN06265380_101790 [Ruegeria faecimaris]|uniref:Uncharacterized protein n=1 Tax=Ruegeria faecimaris TaxID=686389 RepID=A0A521BEE3_9RHOB|nr:hypothetical protein SAMN06265380_101790 [Ruegeria faecimaris]
MNNLYPEDITDFEHQSACKSGPLTLSSSFGKGKCN